MPVRASPPPPQAQQPDVHNLTVRLPGPVRKLRLAVLLTPTGAGGEAPALESLDAWVAAGKLDR